MTCDSCWIVSSVSSLDSLHTSDSVQSFTVHTFSLQAQQQDDEQHEEGEAKADEEEAAGRSLPPYMLKVANLLGDVRLQNCPSPEGQDELYFTAQWEHDGGGVYDIAKFTQPEVICCACATCSRKRRREKSTPFGIELTLRLVI